MARGKKSAFRGIGHWLSDRMIRAVLALLLMLPYERRVPLTGWLVSRLIAPVAGYGRRVRENLALVVPELPESEVRRMMRAVPDNLGRALIEMYSGHELLERVARMPVRGDGLPHLEAARTSGRPVILVTGHFGSYDAARAALITRGFRVGGLYRPMNNPYFNEHYVAAMGRVAQPNFPRGRAGMSGMIRFLREGGMLGVVLDQSMRTGARLRFMGRPALTALSAAEMALRYDALMIPAYAVRLPDGLNFDVQFEAPIPTGTPEAMTQALNDSLEAQVRQHMDQWLWTHRRWKNTGPEEGGPDEDRPEEDADRNPDP
jgi:KDO2-lipid IV(A) lauroyltransferase